MVCRSCVCLVLREPYGTLCWDAVCWLFSVLYWLIFCSGASGTYLARGTLNIWTLVCTQDIVCFMVITAQRLYGFYGFSWLISGHHIWRLILPLCWWRCWRHHISGFINQWLTRPGILLTVSSINQWLTRPGILFNLSSKSMVNEIRNTV